MTVYVMHRDINSLASQYNLRQGILCNVTITLGHANICYGNVCDAS